MKRGKTTDLTHLTPMQRALSSHVQKSKRQRNEFITGLVTGIIVGWLSTILILVIAIKLL
jgi:F0F1-type ATP synthase assembly protein I